MLPFNGQAVCRVKINQSFARLENFIPMDTNFRSWCLFLILPFLLLSNSSFVPGKEVAAGHPLYVSITEINHNAAEKSLEVSCKVFADDMEQVLKQNFKTPVDLSNAAMQEKYGSLINAYVKKNLQISANGKAMPMNFIGFEKESESVYCYFEVPGITALKRLDVVNSVLQDFSTSQINIMHISAGGTRKSTKLDYPAKTASFQF